MIWDLMGLSDVYQAQIKFMLDFTDDDILCEHHQDLMEPSQKAKLSGMASK
jgi:hypothetical protein